MMAVVQGGQSRRKQTSIGMRSHDIMVDSQFARTCSAFAHESHTPPPDRRPLWRCRSSQTRKRKTESAPHVFVEPTNRALPGQLGRGLVVAFRRRIAIEAVNTV